MGGRRGLVASLLGVAAISCSAWSPRSPGDQLSRCRAETAIPESWRPITTHQGGFTIRLPPSAHEVGILCIDSACGEINVGDWKLEFDSGVMAGSGQGIEPPCGVPDARIWCESIRGHRVSLVTYYVDVDNRDALVAERGRFFGEAATARGEAGGLYLRVNTTNPDRVCDFLKAVHTLEVLDREPQGLGQTKR